MNNKSVSRGLLESEVPENRCLRPAGVLCVYIYIYIYSWCSLTYSQFPSQDLRPNGPNPRKVLRRYLSKKGAPATQHLEQILRSEFL